MLSLGQMSPIFVGLNVFFAFFEIHRFGLSKGFPYR